MVQFAAAVACPLAFGVLMWFMLRGLGSTAEPHEAAELATLLTERRRIQASPRRPPEPPRRTRTADAADSDAGPRGAARTAQGSAR